MKSFFITLLVKNIGVVEVEAVEIKEGLEVSLISI